MKIRFDVPPVSDRESRGVAVRYAEAKRSVPRWRWRLLLALVIAPPLYFVLRFAQAYLWATAPGVVEMPQLAVRSGVSGRVVQLVGEGAPVRAGQPLARVLPGDARPPSPPAAPPPAPDGAEAAAREALGLAQQQQRLRRERLAAVQRLAAQGAATVAEIEQARAQLLQASAELIRARADLAAARARAAVPAPVAAPTPPQPLDAALAPFAGEALRTLVQPGEWVSADTEVAVLRRPEPPVVNAYLEPQRARYAQAGRRATLRFPDGSRVRARVTRVAPETTRSPPERASPLAPPGQALLVELRPETPLPERLRVHRLPLDVRFDLVW